MKAHFVLLEVTKSESVEMAGDEDEEGKPEHRHIAPVG